MVARRRNPLQTPEPCGESPFLTWLSARDVRQDEEYAVDFLQKGPPFRGDTLYVLEMAPAGYAYYAANEAEKASRINIINVSGFGSFGRDEKRVHERRDARRIGRARRFAKPRA